MDFIRLGFDRDCFAPFGRAQMTEDITQGRRGHLISFISLHSIQASRCAPLFSFEIYSDTGETKGSFSLFSHFFFEAFGEVYGTYERLVSNVITTYRISIPIAILDIQDVLININR